MSEEEIHSRLATLASQLETDVAEAHTREAHIRLSQRAIEARALADAVNPNQPSEVTHTS